MGGSPTRGRPMGGRRRVLVVHPGAELYGSDRMVVEAVTGLCAAGVEVMVALPATGPLVDRLEALGATVVICPMPVLRKSALSPRGALELLAHLVRGTGPALRLVRSAGRDGVYVSTLTLPLWPLLGRLLRRRVTVHVHEAEGSQPALVRAALAASALLADPLLVNSRYARDVLGRSFPVLARRAVVVRNGVAGPPAQQLPRPVPDGELRLLFVGRLSERKGPQVAVSVLAELQRRGVPASLRLAGAVFAGNEAFEQQLRRQVADAGLIDRVTFLGFTDDVWSVLAGSDVVLVPSLVDEPFGNTAVEAVLAARPLVVSDTSGLREAVEGLRSPRVAPPGDVPAWTDAVQQVLAEWATVRERVADDATTAAARHDPRGYATRLAALTLGDAGATTDRPGTRAGRSTT